MRFRGSVAESLSDSIGRKIGLDDQRSHRSIERGKNSNLFESIGCDQLDYLTATLALLISTKPICKAPAENSNEVGIGLVVS